MLKRVQHDKNRYVIPNLFRTLELRGEDGRPFQTYLLALLVLAFLLRLPLFFFPEVIRSDGAEYVRHAKFFLDGGWAAGKAPPLYPGLIAFAHLVIPDWELAGILVSILFGALLVLPVVSLGKENNLFPLLPEETDNPLRSRNELIASVNRSI